MANFYECPHGVVNGYFGKCSKCKPEDQECQSAKAFLRANQTTRNAKEISELDCYHAKSVAGLYGWKSQEQIREERKRDAENQAYETRRKQDEQRRVAENKRYWENVAAENHKNEQKQREWDAYWEKQSSDSDAYFEKLREEDNARWDNQRKDWAGAVRQPVPKLSMM